MALRRLSQRLTSSLPDLERERLGARFPEGAHEATPISSLPLRRPVRAVGEISAVRIVPHHGSPWLEVTIDDGTGVVTAMFTGRRRLRGVEPGRALLLEGVARRERSRIVLLNPAYTLLT